MYVVALLFGVGSSFSSLTSPRAELVELERDLDRARQLLAQKNTVLEKLAVRHTRARVCRVAAERQRDRRVCDAVSCITLRAHAASAPAAGRESRRAAQRRATAAAGAARRRRARGTIQRRRARL